MIPPEKGKLRNSYFSFWILNKDLTLLFACNLVGAFGDGLYSYLLPIYLSDSLGANSVQIGILYAITSLLAASSLLVAGMLADKYDRKKIMIAGWIAWIPAPLIFAVATNWMQAVPGMILWGIWLGGPTTTAYIVATADRNKLTLTFTMISVAWSIGYIFSPAIGGYVAAVSNMHYVFYLAAVFYCLACAALFFIRSQHVTDYAQRSLEEKASFFKLLRGRKLLTLTIFFASTMFILMMYRPFVVKFLEKVYGYGEFKIGVLGSVLFFGSAVLGIILGRLGDRKRKSYALAVSMVLSSVSLLLTIRFSNFLVLLVAFFLGGGSYIVWSLMGAIIGPLAPERIRARWVSVPQAVSMFSSFVAPYIGGVLYDASPYYPLSIAIVAMAIIASLGFTTMLEE